MPSSPSTLMPRLSATLTTLACAAAFATQAAAATVVLDFEDVPTAGSIVAVPAGYGGITWGAGIGVYGFPEPIYLPKSGVNRALTNFGGGGPTADFSFASDVVFDGLWFSGSGDVVSLNLYNDNVLVGTTAQFLLAVTPVFVGGAFAGPVDRVEIVGQRGQYVFDDVTYSTGVATVPVPGALLMMLSGLVGFGALARRKSIPA